MIKKHKNLKALTGTDYITLIGVMADSKTSKDGEEIEPCRKFSYGKSKVGLNLSMEASTKVDGKPRQIPYDIVCFKESEFEGILELNLQQKDRVEVFCRQTEKGLVIDSCDWVSIPKAI